MTATALRVTGPMIKSMQGTTSQGALVERDDRLEVVHHLPTAELPDDGTVVVLRVNVRRWAYDLEALAREAAEAEGTSTALGTLRAAAGRLATDELAEERARELVVHRPQPRPVVRLHPRGRHAAPLTPQTSEAETTALCQLLDELDEMGLLSRAA